MNSKETGRQGEERAVAYLKACGYEVLERNYRYGRGEIDIIALWQDEPLVFVEVKARTNLSYGEPEDFVHANQRRWIKAAAEDYIYGINWVRDIRFDIIAIDAGKDELRHFEDAFY